MTNPRAIRNAAAAVSARIGPPANVAQVAKQLAGERRIGFREPPVVPQAPGLLSPAQLAKALAVLHQVWKTAEPFLPPRALEPDWKPMTPYERRLGGEAVTFPGVDPMTGRAKVAMLPFDFATLARGRSDPMFGDVIYTAMHELAHTAQARDDAQRIPIGWTSYSPQPDTMNQRSSEGGAEAFTRAVAPILLRRLGIDPTASYVAGYPQHTRWFRHRWPVGYVTRGQFQWDPTQYGQPHA